MEVTGLVHHGKALVEADRRNSAPAGVNTMGRNTPDWEVMRAGEGPCFGSSDREEWWDHDEGSEDSSER